MELADGPLVSILMPVHNDATHLDEFKAQFTTDILIVKIVLLMTARLIVALGN